MSQIHVIKMKPGHSDWRPSINCALEMWKLKGLQSSQATTVAVLAGSRPNERLWFKRCVSDSRGRLLVLISVPRPQHAHTGSFSSPMKT